MGLYGEWRRRRQAPGSTELVEEEESKPALVSSGLRRGLQVDNLGCGGIVAILVAATCALPFVAEGIQRVAGFQIPGQLGIVLWLALAYGGFAARGIWKAIRGRLG